MGVGVVICLKQGADCLHIVQQMPLHPKTPSSLDSFKSRLILPFWYRLIQVVLEKRLLYRCSSSSVYSSLGRVLPSSMTLLSSSCRTMSSKSTNFPSCSAPSIISSCSRPFCMRELRSPSQKTQSNRDVASSAHSQHQTLLT